MQIFEPAGRRRWVVVQFEKTFPQGLKRAFVLRISRHE
jgi:hypothetical protein